MSDRYTKDWRGENIYIGDTIVYSTRRGSWMAIVEAQVKEITDDGQLRVKRIRYNPGMGKSYAFMPPSQEKIISLSTAYVTKA
jgi:hypothetical protein